MTDARQPMRILACSNQNLSAFRTSFTRYAGLFAALDRRYDLVGFVRPQIPPREYYLRSLGSIHPRRAAWSARHSLSPWAFRRRSELAGTELAGWEGRYDVLLQLQTLFAPGSAPHARPYAVYTDNIYPLTERFYPDWAPLGRRRGARWTALERAVCTDAEVVFTMSEFVRRAVIDEYGCEPARVVAVGGGTNLDPQSISSKRDDRPVALFVGDKFAIKGGETLLAAWPDVRRRVPGAELRIVGPPARRDSPEGVRWHGYVADRGELARIYADASVFVMPSHFEAWGHAFQEAMAHGLPCIGTDQLAMPEIITDGVTGLLVPPRDAHALADALTELLGSPGRARSMGRRAHVEIESAGRWDHVVDRMAPHVAVAAARG